MQRIRSIISHLTAFLAFETSIQEFEVTQNAIKVSDYQIFPKLCYTKYRQCYLFRVRYY